MVKVKAPPKTMMRSMPDRISGAMTRAVARFVSGPVARMVTRRRWFPPGGGEQLRNRNNVSTRKFTACCVSSGRAGSGNTILPIPVEP